MVDASVIGPPAWEPGHSVLWLAGPRAAEVAGLFAGSPFDARVLSGGLGAASALKACFGLQSKALPAIWLEMAAAARGYGVEDALRGELARTGVDYAARLDGAAAGGPKAWRWAGEMDEAADAVAALGLPDGFSRAAGEVYRRVAEGGLEADGRLAVTGGRSAGLRGERDGTAAVPHPVGGGEIVRAVRGTRAPREHDADDRPDHRDCGHQPGALHPSRMAPSWLSVDRLVANSPDRVSRAQEDLS